MLRSVFPAIYISIAVFIDYFIEKRNTVIDITDQAVKNIDQLQNQILRDIQAFKQSPEKDKAFLEKIYDDVQKINEVEIFNLIREVEFESKQESGFTVQKLFKFLMSLLFFYSFGSYLLQGTTPGQGAPQTFE